jgi:TonB family protein
MIGFKQWSAALSASFLLHAVAFAAVAGWIIWTHAQGPGLAQEATMDTHLQVRVIAQPAPADPSDPEPETQVENTSARMPLEEIASPPSPPTPPVPKTTHQGGQPLILKAQRPNYPRLDRKRGREGTLVFQVAVDDTGKPTTISLLRSSGTSKMENAARHAIYEKWKFRATGNPYTLKATVEFRLKN